MGERRGTVGDHPVGADLSSMARRRRARLALRRVVVAVPLRGLALLAPVLAGIERLVAVTAIPTAALIALRLGLPPTGVASAAIIVSSFVLPLTVVVISRWLGGLRAESCGILTRNG